MRDEVGGYKGSSSSSSGASSGRSGPPLPAASPPQSGGRAEQHAAGEQWAGAVVEVTEEVTGDVEGVGREVELVVSAGSIVGGVEFADDGVEGVEPRKVGALLLARRQRRSMLARKWKGLGTGRAFYCWVRMF